MRGRARSGRATRSRDPRLSPGPRRPDGKARAGATATVLGRRPVAPWRLCSVARASLPVICIGNPHGQDARGTLRCARNKRFRQMQAGLEARVPGEMPTGRMPNTVAFAPALAFPSGLLGPGERRGSLDRVARPERARPLTLPLPLGRGRGNPGRGRWPGFLPPPALRGEGRGEGPRDPARSARRARLRQEKASQRTSPPHPGSRQVPALKQQGTSRNSLITRNTRENDCRNILMKCD